MPKYYLTASLINAWLKGYDSFYDMLYRRETEPNELMKAGIDFEERAIRGEIEELRELVDGALYQEFVCRECEGYMLLGFCDLIKYDTIYDLKYVQSYEMGKYTDSVQHLIYLYCLDMQKFEYVIGKGDDIFYEFQPRDDSKLKETIHQFINWLKINNLYEVYQQNYIQHDTKRRLKSMRITLDELKNVKTFKEHEEGRYTMRVVKAKEGVTSQSGTEFLQIDCETMGDDVFNINNRFYNTEKALSILLNFLSAVGFYNEGEMVEFEPDDLLGAIFSVELVKGEPNDNGRSYLEFKPWTCEEVSGQATPKKTAKEEDKEEIPF